ncbi:peptidyl-tRNA hydrolase domain-containing protein [Diaporthe helianthi]|uniref:Peptidyl-tRNA hydrolase domain-containing protein n=1 Tax=Diaporthe helianthi TaxID=158607 RepID=A0A2P5I553_DIAHE|nr:peptidyl-tRNA hydrolase domain-containing protein [Diaporthe helianthi]
MWWMKAPGPAGLAARSGSSSSSILLITAAAATFSTTYPAKMASTRYPPRPKPPPEHEFTEVYLKGSGPGGQKINKTNSAVQLKHIPTGIVVKCQDTRSREQNRKLAREHLADKIDDLLNGDQSRSAIVARLKAKKKSSAAKKSRRKHRDIADGREQGEEGEVDDEEDMDTEEAEREPVPGERPKRTVRIQEVRF